MSIFNSRENEQLTSQIQNIVSIIDINGNSLINNFMLKSGDVMTGNLLLQNSNIIFDNGSVQNVAFDEGRISQLDYLTNLTVNISKPTETRLVFNDNVEFSGTITIPNNSLLMSNISGLTN